MAHLDFPAFQKTLAHVCARRPSTVESSEPGTPLSDHSHNHELDDQTALTPQASRYTQPDLTRSATKGTTASSINRNPSFEIDWAEDDRENPRNWSKWYKGFILFTISFGTLVVILYSTTYTTVRPFAPPLQGQILTEDHRESPRCKANSVSRRNPSWCSA